MMPPDPRQAKAIFLDAVDKLRPAERIRFLDAACDENDDLRREVEILLDAHVKAASFLEEPAVAAPTLDQPSGTERPDTQIGPYILVEEIGEGGMGIVYMAVQREPVERKVALKIIRPGMDTREVIARFAAEKQALALMDHPSIAKVLDAGSTESGRPYFVMELVSGVPLTDYCDADSLTTRQRLGLFTQVCQAVQHAHQKGIVHRDLKPSNILVTMHDGVPVPKIIDFGIAKAINQQLASNAVYTSHGQMIGTPLYMSPEQAEHSGLDIDTRSDVYSLGVLLYELLTGSTPFDREQLKDAELDEVRCLIREREPPRPSIRISTMGMAATTVSERRRTNAVELSNSLRHELDWIVMKALEKDRTRRYQTANEFARDIQRYLHDEAVEACPPSTIYRLRRFARRHQTASIVTAAVSLALLLAGGIATGQAVRATKAERHAEEQLQVAQEQQRLAEDERTRAESAERRATTEASIATAINEFLQRDLLQQVDSEHQRDEGFAPQANLTVREALDRASSSIDKRFPDQPLVEARIRIAIAGAYRSVDDRESVPPHLERAVELLRLNLGPHHPETINSLIDLALAYTWVGRVPDAVKTLEQVLQIRTEMFGEDHETTLDAMTYLANVYWEDGQWDSAARLYERTCARYMKLFGRDDPRTVASLSGLGVTLRDSGFPEKAIVILEPLVQECQRRLGTDDPATVFLLHRLAIAYQKAGRLAEADFWFREAIACGRTDETGASRRAAGIQTHLGLNLLLQREFAAAESVLRQAIATYDTEYPNIWRRFHAMNLLGAALLGQQQYADAEPLLLQGYEGMKERESRIFAADKLRLTEALDWIVQFYETTGDFDQADYWRDEMAGGRHAVDPSGQ